MKMIFVIIVLLIGMMISGCKCNSEEVTYYYLDQPLVEEVETKVMKVYIDIGFNDWERNEIWRAMGRWNKVLNGYKRMEDGGYFLMEIEKIKEAESGGVYIIIKLDKGSSLIRNESGKITLGFTDAIGGKYLYLVSSYIGEGDLYGVVLHEFGHLMGARHTDLGLMRASYMLCSAVCVDIWTV